MTALPNSAAARDIAYYFHPATNARRHEAIGPTVIERGQGIHVYDDQGKEYIECRVLARDILIWALSSAFTPAALRALR